MSVIPGMFNIATSESQLKPASQYVNYKWLEADISTDREGDKIFGKTSTFNWTLGAQNWGLLQNAYLKADIKARRNAAGDLIQSSDYIATSICPLAAMISKVRFFMGGVEVMTVDNFPQVHALHNRITNSEPQYEAWTRELGMLDHSFKSRQMKVSVGVGTTVSQEFPFDDFTEANELELDMTRYNAANTVAYDVGTGVITFGGGAPLTDVRQGLYVGDIILIRNFAGADTLSYVSAIGVDGETITLGNKPNLSGTKPAANIVAEAGILPLFAIRKLKNKRRGFGESSYYLKPGLTLFSDPSQPALGPGNYKIEFTFKSKADAISNFYFNIGADSITDLSLEITDLSFYIPMVSGPSLKESVQYLQFMETNVNLGTESVKTGSKSLANFDVHESTEALTLALQDIRNQDTRFDISKFTIGRLNAERYLESYTVKYSNQTRPQNTFDMVYSPTDGVDKMDEGYVRSFQELEKHLSIGACEPFSRFRNLGPFYFQTFAKMPGHKAASCKVEYTIASVTGDIATDVTQNTRSLLFEHSRKVLGIRRNTSGNIVSVSIDYR
jgi:hypothetical protein